MSYLIDDFGYICFGESLWLMTIRNIKFTIPIKTHHAVKTGAIQEKIIQGVMFLVESVSHMIIIIFSVAS